MELACINIEHILELRAAQAVLARTPRVKKLQTEACAERFAETEAFITKAKGKLRSGQAGEGREWIETGLLVPRCQ